MYKTIQYTIFFYKSLFFKYSQYNIQIFYNIIFFKYKILEKENVTENVYIVSSSFIK